MNDWNIIMKNKDIFSWFALMTSFILLLPDAFTQKSTKLDKFMILQNTKWHQDKVCPKIQKELGQQFY